MTPPMLYVLLFQLCQISFPPWMFSLSFASVIARLLSPSWHCFASRTLTQAASLPTTFHPTLPRHQPSFPHPPSLRRASCPLSCLTPPTTSQHLWSHHPGDDPVTHSPPKPSAPLTSGSSCLSFHGACSPPTYLSTSYCSLFNSCWVHGQFLSSFTCSSASSPPPMDG